ncbi:putative Xaa-Pro aminopeptidase PEPP [Dirofilaria immitis]
MTCENAVCNASRIMQSACKQAETRVESAAFHYRGSNGDGDRDAIGERPELLMDDEIGQEMVKNFIIVCGIPLMSRTLLSLLARGLKRYSFRLTTVWEEHYSQ